jgi:translation initiation factor 2B subunit (eIF-2B alpha/beta/delta family)
MWNLKLIALIAIPISLAGSAWYGHSRGVQSGMSQIQMQWDAERAATLAAQAEELMKARQTEQALQKAINRIRQEKTREATRLANDYASVINSLHDRPEARAGASGVPDSPNAGVGCTGAGLAKGDSEFLARYGADAARLQLALDACQAAYDSVRQALNPTQE